MGAPVSTGAILALSPTSASPPANRCPFDSISRRSRRHLLYVSNVVSLYPRYVPRRSLSITPKKNNVLTVPDFLSIEGSIPKCTGGSIVTLGAGWACLSCSVVAVSLPCSWYKIVSDRCVFSSRRDAACHPAHVRLEAWIVNHGPWVP